MIDCPECNGTGTETRERFMAGNVVEYHITCNNCKGKKQIEPMPQTITLETIIADLTDIEISALELANGNFEKETFNKDCMHIAELSGKLVDHYKRLEKK